MYVYKKDVTARDTLLLYKNLTYTLDLSTKNTTVLQLGEHLYQS